MATAAEHRDQAQVLDLEALRDQEARLASELADAVFTYGMGSEQAQELLRRINALTKAKKDAAGEEKRKAAREAKAAEKAKRAEEFAKKAAVQAEKEAAAAAEAAAAEAAAE